MEKAVWKGADSAHPTRLLPWLGEELKRLKAEGLLRGRRCVVPLPGGECLVEGRRLRNFASNDYLDLAHDRRVIDAAKQALDKAGAGARASALVTGRTHWHVRLEERIARFEGEAAAVLFPSGYAANVGTIAALVDPRDTIYCDRLNHASLVDGCRLSGARLRVYRHDRLEKLEAELKKRGAEEGRRWIVSDSVFSMDGDVAPLRELCALGEWYEAAVIIDEAHGTGVFGERGRGVAEWQGVEERIAVRVGTLSKGVGSLGGFVAGPRELVDWLWNRARTQIYSTALPPSACAAACAAFDLIEAEPGRREKLLELSEQFRQRCREAGIRVVDGAVGPIVPVILDDPGRAVGASRALEERGFLVPAIRPPTVPRGTSRLRITLSCAHSEEDVGRLVDALRELV